MIGFDKKMKITNGIRIALGITMILSTLISNVYGQNVGINADGSVPETSTMLDIKSAGTTSSTFGLKVKDSEGDSKMVVRSDGNVGIGTTSPTDLLHLSSAAHTVERITTTSSSSQAFTTYINSDGSSHFNLGVGRTTDGNQAFLNILGTGSKRFLIHAGGTNIMSMLPTNGFVGIGTTDPDNLFHLSGTQGTPLMMFEANSNKLATITVEPSVNDRLLRLTNTSSVGTGGFDFFASDGSYNTSLLRIQNNGNVGIDVSNPTNKLQVSNLPISTVYSTGDGARFHDGNYGVNLGGSSTGLYGWIQGTIGGTGPGPIVIQRHGGNVGIGVLTPTQKLHVSGNGLFTGTVTASCGVLTCSDVRYKENVKRLENTLDKIENLTGVTYVWKQDEFPEMNFGNGKQVGVIAQELEKVYPELVHTDEDGYKTVNYIHLTPILLEAIKEQQQIIENQKGEINSLKLNADRTESRLLLLEEYIKEAKN